MNVKRYYAYAKDTKCSVEGCERIADFDVILYDYYLKRNEEFVEQDQTCPFICKQHMGENELRASGERRPRGTTTYPYTNQQLAQGYTRYLPLIDH